MTTTYHKMLSGKQVTIYGTELIDESAINQLLNCMCQPWTVKGAAMPDMHLGYTMPIGGVIETDQVVVPSWVGFDIGCGVCYVETDFYAIDLHMHKQKIYDAIRKAIPMGFKHHSEDQDDWAPLSQVSTWFASNYIDRGGDKQLGTLGSGNHFIEIGQNNNGNVCFVIHSGSRGIGHNTASHYIKLAHPDNKCGEGSHGLHIADPTGAAYMLDMGACLEFALRNREMMLFAISNAMRGLGLIGGIKWETLINKTHNHAEETIDGTIIHRKGATDSGRGVPGVIPGQSAAGSYIVRGRGNPDSLCSSSHGAGRTGSRTDAKLGRMDANGVRDPATAISLEDFGRSMEGIVAHVGPETVDEAPQAYKDPEAVMDHQTELVEIVDHVQPVICLKDITKPRRKR